MARLVLAVLVVILYFSPVVAQDVKSTALSPAGVNSNFFDDMLLPLRSSVTDSGSATCIGFWWKPQTFNPLNVDEVERSLFLSAGHCRKINVVEKRSDSFIIADIAVTVKDPDVLIGSLTDFRVQPRFFGTKMSELVSGEIALGVAHPMTPGKPVILQKLIFKEKRKEDGVLVFIATYSTRGGMSGSPVVSPAGEIIGILYGYEIENPREIYVTPIQKAEAIYRVVVDQR